MRLAERDLRRSWTTATRRGRRRSLPSTRARRGERAGRQPPVHTCYVPADRVDAGPGPALGRGALAALDEHGAARPRPGRRRSPTEVLPRVRAKLATEPVEDLRVDSEDGYGVRADAEEDAAAARPPRCAADGSPGAPALVGIRVKSLEAPTRRRGVRTPGPASSPEIAPGEPRRTASLVTLPKVTDVEQVRRWSAACSTRWRRRTACAAGAALRAADRDPAGGARRRTASATVARMVHAAGRPLRRACTTAPTTTARRCGIAAAPPVPGPPGRRLRQGGHAGRRRRHRRPARSTARPTCCRSATAAACTPPGGCTPGWSAGRWNAASTRAGTCTRPSWPPGTPPPTPSSAPRCPPPPPGCAPTWTGPTAGVLDEPATARALAAPCSGAWTAAPRRRRGAGRDRASTSRGCVRSPAGQPGGPVTAAEPEGEENRGRNHRRRSHRPLTRLNGLPVPAPSSWA